MPAGRPTEGLEHIEHLQGSFEAKRRLKTIVQSLSGELTVVAACERLRIGSSRFHAIRQEALQAAVQRLEPRPAGRPRHGDLVASERLRALEARVEQGERDLRRERARAEVAIVTSASVRRSVRGGQSRSG